ncbi:MAG: DUF1003 domain-containing protein [Bacteroidales bacterium]|nr:DUF1003 domain-containing protein [Bacteroidales bacterium]
MKKEFPLQERVSGKAIRQSVLDYIVRENPDFTEDKYLAISELNIYRERYISDLLTHETGELSDLEKKVLKSLSKQTTLSDKLDSEKPSKLTFGQRIADKVATFGGSWTFILSFMGFLLVWIAINVFWLANRAFDPFPFILLNLILSCVAALQAPVIMMSQNRQEEKDRDRAKKDYMINLKSELEIRMLHEKMDHLILHQHQEMMEIQKVQIDMMDDLLKKKTKGE